MRQTGLFCLGEGSRGMWDDKEEVIEGKKEEMRKVKDSSKKKKGKNGIVKE